MEDRSKPARRGFNYDSNGRLFLTVHLKQVARSVQEQKLEHQEQLNRKKRQKDSLTQDITQLREERTRTKEAIASLECWLHHWDRESKRLEEERAILEKTIMESALPRFHFNGLSPIDDPSSPGGGSPKVARQIGILRKLRPPPFKYAWNFYHEKNSNSGNYEGRLTLMKDEIITAKPFWEVLNSFPLERLHLKDSVHFFKRGVKPIWEDPRNVKGGCWTFRVPKAHAQSFWKEVLMMAVGEQFADVIQPGDDLCGCSMSVRFNNNLISIWNRDGTKKKTIDGIFAVVLDNLSAELQPKDGHHYYKRHSDHQGFGEVVAKANALKADEGKIVEAEVGSSEADRALLRDEGKSVEDLEKVDEGEIVEAEAEIRRVETERTLVGDEGESVEELEKKVE